MHQRSLYPIVLLLLAMQSARWRFSPVTHPYAESRPDGHITARIPLFFGSVLWIWGLPDEIRSN